METTIKKILEDWGFSVEKIDENQESESPDFLVGDTQSTYLIELKTRNDDKILAKQREETLNLGKIFSQEIPLIPSNSVSGIVKKAQSQLSAETDIAVDFRLAWIAANGRSQQAKKEQIQATLYGSTDILELGSSDNKLKPCYYFRNSEFFRYKDVLDAVILTWNSSGMLCLNTLSPRYSHFRKTELYKHFRKAICDPLMEEDGDRAYIVDSDINRSNSEEVLNYLRTKYNKDKIMNMDMRYHSATIVVHHSPN